MIKTLGAFMKTSFCTLSAALLILLLSFSAQAETRYISDVLVVTVRSNTTNNYKALTTLTTASPVEILKDGKSFVKVRTKKGIEGFIRSQYVTKAIPKATQIARLKNQKAALEDKLRKQQLEFQDATGLATSSQAIIEQLTADLNKTMKQLEKVNKDYTQLKDQSANVLSVTTERDQLLEENNQIISELQVLQEENESFHRSNMIQWFLAGGAVFLVGWLAGKTSRKKRSYGSF